MRSQAPLFLALVAFSAGSLRATISVTLNPYLPSPQPLGTTINMAATVSDSDPGSHIFRFSAEPEGAPVQIKRDYSPNDVWPWTPTSFEGAFTIGVDVINTSTQAAASAKITYDLTSLLLGGHAVVNATAHPLVALFSAPACHVPNSLHVRFQRPTDPTSQATNLLPCRYNPSAPIPDQTSMNTYIAGMYQNSTYTMHWEILDPRGNLLHAGTDLSFTTGTVPSSVYVPSYNVIIPPPLSDIQQPILLEDYLSITTGQGTPVPAATDLTGNILWYLPYPVAWIGRTEWGGNMFAIFKSNTDPTQDRLIEVDLAGNIVLDTNTAQIDRQLAVMGFRPITGIHHEGRRIYAGTGLPPDGYIMTIGADEMSSTTAQGGTQSSPVDIIGDEVVVMDSNLQVHWVWDSFQQLDVNRAAPLGETCTHSNIGCEPFNPAFNIANDWLHSNSLQYTPWDGNIILSMRDQDWVIKIDYANGAGNGSVIWRMGPHSDFTLSRKNTHGTADLGYPWFSHQHDAEFERNGVTVGGRYIFTVYDDGNTRQAVFDSNANSRCQLLMVDETGRAANLNQNADMGTYNSALGSAQLLTNGNLHCDNGFIGGFTGVTQTTESDKTATIVYNLGSGFTVYRSFRMSDLYTPVTP